MTQHNVQSVPSGGAASADPIASIVIPAHNEASVLGRLLDTLPSEVKGRPLQIVVACNGCTDNTAAIARERGATVVEVAAASKIAALNAADEVATAFPRLYVDADVVVTRKTITDVIETLSDPSVLCAAPPYRMELQGRPWTVRAYYAVWLRVMSLRAGYVGSGVYALSEAGRARFGRFPDVVADDTFVRNLFSRTERRIVDTDPSIVESAWTLRALLRRRIRVGVGNMQLRARQDSGALPGNFESAMPWWHAVLTRPALLPAALVYAGVNAVAYLAARQQLRSKQSIDWARDHTTRSTSV